MKRTLTTFLLLHLLVIVAVAQQDCPYCGGTGKIVKNISVSQYGLSKEKVKCPTCGVVTYKSTGHCHIHCQYCGGTGKKRSTSYSRNGSSSRRTLDDIARENPAAFSMAMSIKYGIPMNDTEYEYVSRLDSQMQKLYMQLRNLVENDIIYSNQSISMLWYRTMTANSVNQRANNTYQQICSLDQTMLNYLRSHPSCGWDNQLKIIMEKHIKTCHDSLQQLLDLVKYNQSMEQLQDRLWNYQLYRNMF